MFQLKEQDKTSEKELKEMELRNLPDRVQSNGHKTAHWTWESNGWTQWNFNQETENTREYQTEATAKLKNN